MSLENVPWFIDGGAEHPPEVARSLAYAATKGATGVLEPRDMHVHQTSVPGESVAISSGVAVMQNGYGPGSRQSYMARNSGEDELHVPATGSSGGKTRYVIVRIDDPQYGAQKPDDVKKGPYTRFTLVSRITGLKYPHVVLAKITQPASTATITNDMIEDMREVAAPREQTIRRPRQIHQDDPGQDLRATRDNGEWFPNAGQQYIDIPEWATRAQINADWMNIRVTKGNNPFGEYWVEWGPGVGGANGGTQDRERSTEHNFFNHFKLERETYYQNWMLRADVYIPYRFRGTRQLFVFKAKYNSSDKGVGLHATGGMNMDVKFLEVADPSTS